MTDVSAGPGPSWIREPEPGTLAADFDTGIYPLEVIFRAAYAFTDRCYLYLDHAESRGRVVVHFWAKRADSDLARLAAEFATALVDQRVRFDLERETRPIRELVVAQAFAEGAIFDRSAREADYHDDPKGIRG